MSSPQGALVILLIGPSGSGKSSFVQSLASERITIDNTLRPCTAECKLYNVSVKIHSRYKDFILIDTPGFVDTPNENIRTLKRVAKILDELAPARVFGAIYFHNIGEVRLNNTSTKVLDIFKAICGDKFYPHVAFVTTMWDMIKPKYHDKLQVTHNELKAGPMNICGPQGIFPRLRNDDECSKKVLEYFADLARRIPAPYPQLQLLEEFQGNAGDTSAGHQILKESRSGALFRCCSVM